MEIRVLKYFLAVAREENITKAAEFLHITQPTLSRQLMQLEEELNTTLFIRGKNRITLTDEGMLLRRRAQEIIDLADKTEKEFLNQEDIIAGEIFIGGGESAAMHLVAKVIKEFNKKYPNVKYQLYSGNADDIKEKIDQGLIDIGLLIEPVNIEKYDFVRLNHQERWGVLAPSDSSLASKEFVILDDLIDLPLIIPQRAIVQQQLSNWFKHDFDKLNIIGKNNLSFNAAVMVEEKIGYAICIDKIVDQTFSSKVKFIPLSPKLETGTVIVWKKHQIFSPTTSKFIETIKEILG